MASAPAPAGLRIIEVADSKSFDSVVEEQARIRRETPGSYLFILIEGAKDPATGVSWCPDCVQADPHIEKALHALENVTLIRCPVPRSEYKGNPNHPYRLHRALQLKAVPTLYLWTRSTSKGPWRSLVEEQLFSDKHIESLIEENKD